MKIWSRVLILAQSCAKQDTRRVSSETGSEQMTSMKLTAGGCDAMVSASADQGQGVQKQELIMQVLGKDSSNEQLSIYMPTVTEKILIYCVFGL